MPYRIGGYFMSFSTVHKFAINFWLCDHDKLDVLAAYIHWDAQPGMMLVSSFKYIPYGMPDSEDWEESLRDRTIAKEWLMNGAGVKADELKWISLLDNRKITAKGIQPKRMTIGKSTMTPAEVIEEMKEAVRLKRELELSDSNNH
ncbi:hypothetical protein BDZ97DRAFT_1753745 [Flammula alnicola]|nr:hypothetical protein BDZ97DRAFT_1753745 [Flammula alnicola]